MTPVAVQAFASQALPAGALAAALGVPFEALALHHFPDGELMPVAPHPPATVIAYCSLDRPNDKLVALLRNCKQSHAFCRCKTYEKKCNGCKNDDLIAHIYFYEFL